MSAVGLRHWGIAVCSHSLPEEAVSPVVRSNLEFWTIQNTVLFEHIPLTVTALLPSARKVDKQVNIQHTDTVQFDRHNVCRPTVLLHACGCYIGPIRCLLRWDKNGKFFSAAS